MSLTGLLGLAGAAGASGGAAGIVAAFCPAGDNIGSGKL